MIKMYARKYGEHDLKTGLCFPCRASGKETPAEKMIVIGLIWSQEEDCPVNVCGCCRHKKTEFIVDALKRYFGTDKKQAA